MNLQTLPQLSQDKANHLAYGAALCAAFGIGKEIYDRVSRNGTPDVLDAAATLLGGALVLAPLAAWRWEGYL